MAQSLADETLLQILSYLLSVSNDDFCSNTGRGPSPFHAGHSYWSPSVPLVCKRWWRIATPLVYGTVVLRTRSQAEFLVRTLGARPEYGPFIRRLRIEGGFGAPADKVLQAAVQLQELHLSLDLTSKDSVKPMCKALPALNPSRLSLSVRIHRFNIASISAVVEGLRGAAKSWVALTTLVVPYDALAHQNFVDALFELQNVETIYIPGNIGTTDFLEPVLQRWPRCTVHINASRLKLRDNESTVAFLAKHVDRVRVHDVDFTIP